MISIDQILQIKSKQQFNETALGLFKYQSEKNKVYRQFLKYNNVNANSIKKPDEIPFMPVGFFKTHKIVTGNSIPELKFLSSGTSNSQKSIHYVSDIELYKKTFINCFNFFYANHKNYCFLALLPSYLEREGSSLIFMMKYYIKNSKYPQSGFYLHNLDELYRAILFLIQEKIPVILFGVSFALLDFAEKYTLPPSEIVVMETGGMKGKREEITREELHNKLKKAFNVPVIHSEYGMTELMSQAYSKGNGHFFHPPWMKIYIRDNYDPKGFMPTGKTGGVNIIDLANINSIAFIETQDMGKLNNNGDFEITGRIDNSELRGCNLLL